MADVAKADEVVKPIKARTRKAATHLRAVTSEPMVEVKRDVDEHVASLREQIAALAHQVEQFAEDRYGEAHELVSNIGDAGAVLSARAGRQTIAAARSIRNDPLPTIVALGVLSLLAAIVVGRVNSSR
jgi:hypothetical protein